MPDTPRRLRIQLSLLFSHAIASAESLDSCRNEELVRDLLDCRMTFSKESKIHAQFSVIA